MLKDARNVMRVCPTFLNQWLFTEALQDCSGIMLNMWLFTVW